MKSATKDHRELKRNLPTSGSGGTQPGIDLDNSAAIVDVIEKFETIPGKGKKPPTVKFG